MPKIDGKQFDKTTITTTSPPSIGIVVVNTTGGFYVRNWSEKF
jgi:hypothetical protein